MALTEVNAARGEVSVEHDMTQREAMIEAKRRWGESGLVRLRPPSLHQDRDRPGRLARYRYLVGNGRLGPGCTIVGQGNSWSEAFDDARARPTTGRALLVPE